MEEFTIEIYQDEVAIRIAETLTGADEDGEGIVDPEGADDIER